MARTATATPYRSPKERRTTTTPEGDLSFLQHPFNNRTFPTTKTFEVHTAAEKRRTEQSTALPAPRLHSEHEHKFFVPLRELCQAVDLSILPSVEIIQHLFPDRLLTFVTRYAISKLDGDADRRLIICAEKTRWVTGRLRRIEGGDKSNLLVRHMLELKGKKTGHQRCRMELSIPISELEYRQLLPLAERGAIRKRRYHLDGHLYGKGGDILTTAEIDILTHAGKPRPSSNFSPPPLTRKLRFALVDIEYTDPRHRDLSLNHRHSFRFLETYGVNLTHAHRKVRKPLTARHLSEHGVDEQTDYAVKALLKFVRKVA